MPDYSIFGGCLRSELPFPDLRPVTCATPRWTLGAMVTEWEDRDGEVIGEMTDLPCTVQLRRTASGFRLSHSCTGHFDVSSDGSRIDCAPRAAADEESLRYDILGRVMSVALHAGGGLCLHASGVRIAGRVVAFLAPKGYGKSTLASALLNAGAQLATDDTLPIELSTPISVLPGIHHLRLRHDSAARLLDPMMERRRGVDGKQVVEALDDDRLMLEASPLAALYLLAPAATLQDGGAAARTLLAPRAAALSLVTHAKIGPLLGKSEASVVLNRAVAVARHVPVYRLGVLRDLSRLDDVVDQLMGWHGALEPVAEV